MSDSSGTPWTDQAKQLWKRTERQRAQVEAAVEIPLVIWGAAGNPMPQQVRTDVPGQQGVEWRVQDKTEVQRFQQEHQDWAEQEKRELKTQAQRLAPQQPGHKPTRKADRSRTRD